MFLPAKPRLLKLLRIEDEGKALPLQQYPLIDLGRIGRWAPFVRGLAVGTVEAEDSEGRLSKISGWPDIITNDFRFDKDDTTPHFPQDDELQEHPVYGRVRWSEKLRAKNTGILIGAMLMGAAAERDLPTVTTFHTFAPDETGDDVSTVLLLGQMLASAGWEFPEDADIFERTFSYMRALPSTCEQALLSAIPSFREQLLKRFGTNGGRRDVPIRLYVNPLSVELLLSQFDGATSEEDLDRRLSKVGLEVWDRDGDGDCLDIRSLFLEVLLGSRSAGERGLLPLASVKTSGKQDGEVLAFVSEIYRTVGSSYQEAAQVVRENLRGLQTTIKGRHRSTQLLGVLFAYVEEAIRINKDFKQLIRQRWDPLRNETTDDPDAYTLIETMLALTCVMNGMADLFRPSQLPENGWWPLSGRPASILQAVHRYIKDLPDGETETVKVLLQTLNYSDQERHTLEEEEISEEDTPSLSMTEEGDNSGVRETIVRSLLEHLITAGLVSREEKNIQRVRKDGSKKDEKKWLFRLLDRRASREIFAKVPEIDERRVVSLLGYRLETSEKERSNELKRIVLAAGYANWRPFLSRLVHGPVPRHLAHAAQWYVETYYSQLSQQEWPPQCVFKT